jgi:hypothetical protein
VKRLIVTLIVAGIAVGVADAQPRWRFQVTGGDKDLKNAIVALPFELNKREYYFAFSVTEGDKQPSLKNELLYTGRLGSDRAELLVLIPELKARQSMELQVQTLLPPAGAMPPPRMLWRKLENDTQELCLNDQEKFRPILSYTQHTFDPKATPPKKTALENPTIKPYHHAFDSTGAVRLTNGPDGRYPHHRGIYFGFNNITYGGKKKADVWHCRNGESQQADPKQTFSNGWWIGSHRLNVAWCGQDGGTFANETREIVAYEMAGGTLIDFRSQLTTDLPDGVKLDGDPQHAGFHFRANAKVEEAAKKTYFLRPEGKGKEGEEKNWEPKSKKGPVNLPWNAMCFELEGKRYTVVYLDHPDSPKEARQSERTYGRIGTYFEYHLTKEKPLFVRYRLWIQDGEMSAETCAQMSQAFSAKVSVVRK